MSPLLSGSLGRPDDRFHLPALVGAPCILSSLSRAQQAPQPSPSLPSDVSRLDLQKMERLPHAHFWRREGKPWGELEAE